MTDQNEHTDTLQTNDAEIFKKQVNAWLKSVDVVFSGEGNIRNIFFALASAADRQLRTYLLKSGGPIDNTSRQLKTLLRAATAIENGTTTSDSQEHAQDIEERRIELENRLSGFLWQAEEMTTLFERSKAFHDEQVMVSGRGRLYDEIIAAGEAKRNGLVAPPVAAKGTPDAVTNEITKGADAMLARFAPSRPVSPPTQDVAKTGTGG